MEKCPLCKGRGMQIHIQQIGPGMVQQIQTVCIECKGQGERINPKDRCESCSGAKVIREKKIIEVHVEKGEATQLSTPHHWECFRQLTVGCTGQASGMWDAGQDIRTGPSVPQPSCSQFPTWLHCHPHHQPSLPAAVCCLQIKNDPF